MSGDSKIPWWSRVFAYLTIGFGILPAITFILLILYLLFVSLFGQILIGILLSILLLAKAYKELWPDTLDHNRSKVPLDRESIRETIKQAAEDTHQNEDLCRVLVQKPTRAIKKKSKWPAPFDGEHEDNPKPLQGASIRNHFIDHQKRGQSRESESE